MPSNCDWNVLKKKAAIIKIPVWTVIMCILGVATFCCAVQRVKSSKAKFWAAKQTCCSTCTRVDSADAHRPEAQTQPILSADWFTEMTDLNGCALKLFLLAVQDSECACAQHYWLDFRRYTALFIWLYLSNTKGRLRHTLSLKGTNQINWKKKKAEKKHWVKSANRILGCVCSLVINIGAHAALLWKTQMPHDRQQVKEE